MVSISESIRSFAPITPEDMTFFASHALGRLRRVYDTAPVAALYKDRLALMVLAQGGALHYLSRDNGLKDIDIWAFFISGPDKSFPWRARWTADIGITKFGRSPDDHAYIGRRIDIMGRSIEIIPEETVVDAVRRWLRGSSASAQLLSTKPAYAIYPEELCGTRIN